MGRGDGVDCAVVWHIIIVITIIIANALKFLNIITMFAILLTKFNKLQMWNEMKFRLTKIFPPKFKVETKKNWMEEVRVQYGDLDAISMTVSPDIPLRTLTSLYFHNLNSNVYYLINILFVNSIIKENGKRMDARSKN